MIFFFFLFFPFLLPLPLAFGLNSHEEIQLTPGRRGDQEAINMPLVVPGLQSTDGGKDDWMSKLMGKKIGEQHDEMVSLISSYPSSFFSPSSLVLCV